MPLESKTVVTEPVNTDINAADLGKQPINKPPASVVGQNVETLGVKQGASTNMTSPNTYPPTAHSVEIRDYTPHQHVYYDYLVHCLTCGWESRVKNEPDSLKAAQDIADQHIKSKLESHITK